MIKKLLPQEYVFFDCFEKASNHTASASKLLLKMTSNMAEAPALAQQIDDLEHTCDDIAHDTMEKLNKTFITPLDREDIHGLILRIDDVIDLIKASSSRMMMYKIDKPTKYAADFAALIVKGCEMTRDAVHGMRDPKKYAEVQRLCIAIHGVENEADDVLHEAVADLFVSEKDPINLVKWKDIYETMEMVTDCCEDVANVLQGIIVKMS